MAEIQKIGLTSPLGENTFPSRAVIREELGRLFEIELDLLSEEPALDFDQILGKQITIDIDVGDGKKRVWNGHVCEFSQGFAVGHYSSYHATVRPWLWMLTRTSDCRIFQEESVPDIIKKVFRDHGYSDFKDKLSGGYDKRTYCVQYRETDFDFVSRLMEEEGIYYYFEHEKGKHSLVLGDAASSHSTVSGYEKIPFFPPGGSAVRERDHISGWSVVRKVQPGTVAFESYDFERPKASLEAKSVTPWKHAAGKFEMYDYPGRYTKSMEGDHLARVRMEGHAARHERVSVEGSVRGVGVGDLFSLSDFPRADQNREYLVVSAHYLMESDEQQAGSSSSEPFQCRFDVLPSRDHPFRTAQTTPRPVVEGPQTAIVVGKKGEEIWTDKHGRVKVQFPWDRYGKSDESSSCWVRVGTPWAGKSFGGVQIPRIGEEVIVDFLEGNPDCPIITGRVYNGDNMPPYALPANQTQSGFKTRSSKGGGAESFNELRFEDEKGEEEVYLHAEKDMNRVVENDDTLKVGFEKKDEGDQTVEIFNNQTVRVGTKQATDGSQTVEIYKDRTTSLETGNDSLEIKQGDQTIEIKAGNQTIDLGGGNQTIKLAGGNQTIELQAGNQKTKLAAGKATTEAMQGIELKVGPSSIKIDPSGITIKGMMVKIEGQAMTDVKGAMTTVQGQGMLALKGGVLMMG